jgi:hypothetical protein
MDINYIMMLVIVPATPPNLHTEYHGILINSLYGTHLYDPFNAPNARDSRLSLGLQTGESAGPGAAVANGPLAYFASARPGTRFYHWHNKMKIKIYFTGPPAFLCKRFRHIIYRLRRVLQRHPHTGAHAGSGPYVIIQGVSIQFASVFQRL